MKYVDEFPDPAKARALVSDIERLLVIPAARRRPLQVMEVCGGHADTIFRHGIQHMLPEAVEFVHGPGCPVCVPPMRRIDDRVALAERPDAIFTMFGDAMLVPGSPRVSGLAQESAEGEGGRRGCAHGLFAAGCVADRSQAPGQGSDSLWPWV